MPNILNLFRESILTFGKSTKLHSQIEDSANTIINALKLGNKVLVMGNGGSAAQAQHFSAELMIRFKEERISLPAIALNTDSSNVTACGNDYGFDYIFSRQVAGLAKKGDVLVGLTTSGNSRNIINAFKIAKKRGVICICLNGKGGGKINDSLADFNLIIPSDTTSCIQEMHIFIIHSWCYFIDEAFKD